MKTPEQRQKHLNKVFQQSCLPFRCDQQTVSNCEGIDEAVYEEANNNTSSAVQTNSCPSTRQHLSVPVQQSGITNLSAELLPHMWGKAERLFNTHGNICNAPGMPDSFCVASEGGCKPHIVSKNKKGTVICDEVCLGWKSQKMCSHVLAAAEKMGCLDKTLQAYRKLKQPINYTSALTHGLSKNVGKKPGATSKRKGPPGVSKPDVQWYVDPFSASAMDGLKKSSGTYHTESLPGGTSSACSTQS